MSRNEPLPIACDLTAMDESEREQHELTATALFAAVIEVQELADGYGFRLPVTTAMLRSAAEWIANERLCCPFFTFSLKVEAESAGLWVMLTGSEDVKAFVRAEFGSILAEGVAAGLS